MENLKTAVANMVRQIPTTPIPTPSIDTPETEDSTSKDDDPPPPSNQSTKRLRIDGYIWPPTGAKTLAKSEEDKVKLKD
jgi:hypothetical protein